MWPNPSRRLATAALSTGLLVATVVGSGIMADALTADTALALLANTVATGAILVVLITMLGPLSGAHFNPAVSLVFALRRELPARDLGAHVLAQFAGGGRGGLPHGMTAARRSARTPSPRSPRRSRRPGMTVTIYHNPECRTSRNTLALIRASSEEPKVIEYLITPPTRERLVDLIAAAGLTVREAIRQKGTPYEELGLADLSLPDDQLLDAMLAHPILINRPFVETARGVRLARPSELVLEVLENPPAEFAKEDGEVVRAPVRGPGEDAARG